MVIFARNRWILKKFTKKNFFPHKSLVILAQNPEILKKCAFFGCRNHWWFLHEIDEIGTKMEKYSWRNHWGFLTETSEIWRFFICFATGNHWWFLQRIEKLLTVFTISNRNQALKHEESVLRPNGHRFWEVILWWFLAIFDRFYHIKSKSGTKTRKKRPTAKRTPVLCHSSSASGVWGWVRPGLLAISHPLHW